MRNVPHTPPAYWGTSPVLRAWRWPNERVSPCGVCTPNISVLIHPSLPLCTRPLWPCSPLQLEVTAAASRCWIWFSSRVLESSLGLQVSAGLQSLSPDFVDSLWVEPTPAPRRNLLYTRHQVGQVRGPVNIYWSDAHLDTIQKVTEALQSEDPFPSAQSSPEPLHRDVSPEPTIRQNKNQSCRWLSSFSYQVFFVCLFICFCII